MVFGHFAFLASDLDSIPHNYKQVAQVAFNVWVGGYEPYRFKVAFLRSLRINVPTRADHLIAVVN